MPRPGRRTSPLTSRKLRVKALDVLAVAPSHLQLEGWLPLNSRRALRRLLLALSRWRLAFRFRLRQLELDGGYGLVK